MYLILFQISDFFIVCAFVFVLTGYQRKAGQLVNSIS